MRKHENVRTDSADVPVCGPATGPKWPGGRLLALQSEVGNAVVVQMLRQAGHPEARADRPHGGGDPRPSAVQRSAVHAVLRSEGRPLDEATRTDMESRLGADFSDVRIHTDAAARVSAAEVGARAYTSGSHVVIGDGGGDRHTLAHELTHVIQQRQGPVLGTDNGAGLSVSDPSDRFEREAEANVRRVLGGPAPVRRLRDRDTPVPGGAGPDTPVQRTSDTEMASQSSSGSEMDVDHPSTADADHRAAVAKTLSEQKPSNLSLMGKYLTATVWAAPIAGGPEDGGRPKRLSQIGTESLNRLYTEDPGPKEDPEWRWDRKSWSKVRAEVEAVHAYLSARTRLADGGGLMHSKSDKQWLMVKPPLSPGKQAASSKALNELPFYESPALKPAPGSATPDQVLLGNGTAMTRGATYAFDSPDGTAHRMITYAKDMPAEIPDLALPPASAPAPIAALGGLMPVTQATKTAGPVTVDQKVLSTWGGGRRDGHKPDQNGAMKGVSASKAAKESGMADGDWQWLHLIAFTMGGHDGKQPNAPENLAAGLAAANGHHLVLETLVKKMILQAGISEVKVTATAKMVTGSYHVCSGIDYRLEWTQNGRPFSDVFKVNALNPNKSMGGHLALLDKQYVAHHP
ncbi:DUF4157 domain-containing protein [Streptomyces sp. NPDC015032]|uniref:eCIS core domain-containing protein n=1 Tax=Streptomyces sp. NPDC015032 TaxID=3364937 RepID=UPI0036FD7BD4